MISGPADLFPQICLRALAHARSRDAQRRLSAHAASRYQHSVVRSPLPSAPALGADGFTEGVKQVRLSRPRVDKVQGRMGKVGSGSLLAFDTDGRVSHKLSP